MKKKIIIEQIFNCYFIEFIKYQKLVGPHSHNPIIFNVYHKTQDEVEEIPFAIKPDENIIMRLHGNIRNCAFMLCILPKDSTQANYIQEHFQNKQKKTMVEEYPHYISTIHVQVKEPYN